MKLLLAIVTAAMLTKSTAADSCAVSTLSRLLLNQNIGQCSDDSGYAFTTGRKPTSAEVGGMCASDACHNLLNDVKAMNLTECTLPIGDKIYLFADLIDFVSDQCDGDTPTPSTVTPEPATAVSSEKVRIRN
ncbi:elicitin, putative [Phytophthora infestans T30-4]|uniref:Elicitin n=1 Tax=Phytophthora infestans (strain T30-4) TaxID=403677 RepID=D0NUA9_PHYIT|nr:elicitin, putative [Phytophthora infestans T30-4]EEY65242.1 elicitin, putative [Phytophthora infestans T30-4]|eukprot:XP_002897306.1 elicitin, putative [Phytophthora infestans T30-4]